MSEFITFYSGDPTKDKADGTMVSEGTFTNPVSFALNASKEETGYVKLGIRCKDGYQAAGAITVKIQHKKSDGTYEDAGGNISKYGFCVDNNYTADNIKDVTSWATSLTLANVTDTNSIFWIRCTSSKDEEPATDRDCVLSAEAIVKAKA